MLQTNINNTTSIKGMQNSTPFKINDWYESKNIWDLFNQVPHYMLA